MPRLSLLLRAHKTMAKLGDARVCMMSSVRAELCSHPRLRSLLLYDVVRTGKTIGSGSYGSIEEVAIPGALCAAKKIHDFLTRKDSDWLSRETADAYVQKFLSECNILSRLRHPHVVQFLGLWFEGGSSLHLVMEKLMTSLHDVFEPDDPKSSGSTVPLGLKCSILRDIASGLAFLHRQSPPVIHRDLSARNVLLNSAMAAKIADLGMARIMPAVERATMTKAPGTLVYMPPEALDDSSRYSTSIDIFSLGVLVIFVLVEEFPQKLKAPTYANKDKKLVARTELERREEYTKKIYSSFPESHPLIKLMVSCLENSPTARPSSAGAIELLDKALAEVHDSLHTKSKLELIQMLEKSSEDLKLLEKNMFESDQETRRMSDGKSRRKAKTKARIFHTRRKVHKGKVTLLRMHTIAGASRTPPPRFTRPHSDDEQSEVRKDSAGQPESQGDPYSDYYDEDPPASDVPPKENGEPSLKAHKRKENWYRDISREEAAELLCSCEKGTFLCRPSSQQTQEQEGWTHTHTIDIVCDSVKHVKVIMERGKYCLSTTAEKFDSLMEMVLHYSRHSLITHDTFLEFPLFSTRNY